MDKLDPEDLYAVGELLSDEERLARETTARFVDEKALPLIPEAFEAGRFPDELIPEMAELGLFGSYFDDYGCAGLSGTAYGVICQELERGDSGLRSFVSVQTSLVMFPIHEYGSDEQKSRWLPALAKGEAIGCFGLTEPQGGSDPGNMKTVAKKDGGDWLLNGAKMWITNGTIADVAVVWARTEGGVRGFLVEKGMKGFDAPEVHHKMSLRASVTSALYFDNVRVPEANVLPGVQSLRGPLSCLTQARYGITWGVIGAASACSREARNYVKERTLFGRTLDHMQLTQARLAEMARGITAAQLLSWRLGQLKDQGNLHPTQVSLAKWNNARMAIGVARDARDLLGGAGITTEFSPIRHALNLESVITYEGTESVHQLAVGREITGINAF
ncbi:MAG TPA: acyl-CoA dehydrogenase family protein [Gammaproteobacteria bacterium]|nr:acyl-CoA dehydrogenase family protein [Gammaproteobacteria bacterium]